MMKASESVLYRRGFRHGAQTTLRELRSLFGKDLLLTEAVDLLDRWAHDRLWAWESQAAEALAADPDAEVPTAPPTLTDSSGDDTGGD